MPLPKSILPVQNGPAGATPKGAGEVNVSCVLPLQETQAAHTLRGSRASTTILLVEDEEFVREVTCEVLEFEGFSVLKARSAVEALRAFHLGANVQLLLTDVVLPGRNGCRLARDLLSLDPGLKVVLISGYPENEIPRGDLPDCEAIYLSKPFSVESLMQAVRSALQSRDHTKSPDPAPLSS